MREKIKAFMTGVKEFRSDCTTHYDDNLIEYYDAGRELAHLVTFRKWER